MQEDKTPDTATENFEGTDAVETPQRDENVKPRFKIDFFQVARVHTEQVIEEFDDEAAARAYAEDLCKDKGIKPDFEIEELPMPEISLAEDVEPQSENSPEGSDEKTTQENSLPVN